jgi:hypothetical protein
VFRPSTTFKQRCRFRSHQDHSAGYGVVDADFRPVRLSRLGVSPFCIPECRGKVSVFVIWGQLHRDAREVFEQSGSACGLSYSRPFRKAIAPRVLEYCEATRVFPGKPVQVIRSAEAYSSCDSLAASLRRSATLFLFPIEMCGAIHFRSPNENPEYIILPTRWKSSS